MNIKKNNKQSTSLENISLKKKITLRKTLVDNEVKKQNITTNNARVVFVLDHSGSMRTMYKDGTVQDLLERVFPLAMHFDDNAEMEFYWFDTLFKELLPVNDSTIDGYVSKVILSKKEHFGGTCYAPIMNEIFERYALKEPSLIPTFVIFITDGNNSDKTAAKEALAKASKYNIFWKYIGIGNEKFDFLARLDTLKGRFIDNANFINISNINEIDDSTLYKLLLEEYGDWLTLCKENGILK